MSVKDISTQELVKELLSRFQVSCIEIQIGKIMQIAHYPTAIFDEKFEVSAESHMTLRFDSAEEATACFFNLSHSLREMK